MFNKGSRQLQKEFDTYKLANRLRDKEARNELSHEDQRFIENQIMFFLATCNQNGEPLCGYRGGDTGFVKALSNKKIAFPDYDGNGTFRNLGNLIVNPNIGLLFIDFRNGNRTVVEGVATISRAKKDTSLWTGAQLAIFVNVKRVFTLCDRYVHHMRLVDFSSHIPREEQVAPFPEWKTKGIYRDVLPERDLREIEKDNSND